MLIQLMLFMVYIIPVRNFDFSCFTSVSSLFLILTIVGLFIVFGSVLQLRNQLSPFPNPSNNGVLITKGFYKISRHPMYSGVLLMAFSYALYACSFFKIIVSVGLLILFYFKSLYEEKLLSKQFSKYQEYKKRVGRFFPGIVYRI